MLTVDYLQVCCNGGWWSYTIGQKLPYDDDVEADEINETNDSFVIHGKSGNVTTYNKKQLVGYLIKYKTIED